MKEETEPILVLKDEDIFPVPLGSRNITYELRTAVKVILVDSDGKMALVGKSYRLLPGGGVEPGESLVDAARRECLEETGCQVEIVSELATILDYRARTKRKQVTHCFIARVVGQKGRPKTLQPDEKDIAVEWTSLDLAIKKLKDQLHTIPLKNYNACFNVRAHIAFLEKFKEWRTTHTGPTNSD